MDFFVARQPIFNKNRSTYGYELLFHGGIDNIFKDIDRSSACSMVLSNSFLCIGIERITGRKKAFIEITPKLLRNQIPTLFSSDILYPKVFKEILQADNDVLFALKALKRKGYQLVLDDFESHEQIEPLIKQAAIIKLNIRNTHFDEMKTTIHNLAEQPLKFLAYNIETHEEYQSALKCGFTYFQGSFFCKPETIQGRTITSSKIKMLQIIIEANRKEADFNHLEYLLKTDLGVTFKLLKYMNSAFFQRPNQITSVKEAILYLGLTEFRKFVSLVAASQLSDSKPNELIRASIIRAKLCEFAGHITAYSGETSELFLLGLLSLIDAIMDMEMEDIVNQLPLSPALKNALIKEEGELACYLRLVRCYERGNWNDCPELDGCADLKKITIDQYIEAIGWADSLTGTVWE